MSYAPFFMEIKSEVLSNFGSRLNIWSLPRATRSPFVSKGLFPLGLRVDSQASPLTKCCELDVNSASYL